MFDETSGIGELVLVPRSQSAGVFNLKSHVCVGHTEAHVTNQKLRLFGVLDSSWFFIVQIVVVTTHPVGVVLELNILLDGVFFLVRCSIRG